MQLSGLSRESRDFFQWNAEARRKALKLREADPKKRYQLNHGFISTSSDESSTAKERAS